MNLFDVVIAPEQGQRHVGQGAVALLKRMRKDDGVDVQTHDRELFLQAT